MKRIFLHPLVFFLLIVTPAAFGASDTNEVFSDAETAERIEELLLRPDFGEGVGPFHYRVVSRELLHNLYQSNKYSPLWMTGSKLKPDVHLFLNLLRDANLQGLCNDEYLLAELDGLYLMHKAFSRHGLSVVADNRALLDIFLSHAFLAYATHLLEGQVLPETAHTDWLIARRTKNLSKLLIASLKEGSVVESLIGLSPPHDGYKRLIKVLQQFRHLSVLGGWPHIPEGGPVQPGKFDSRIPLIKEHLILTGDLSKYNTPLNYYDEATVAGIQRFQARHGVTDDGVINNETLDALNVPVEERIRQIELNLERWRWMPEDFGDKHILVNVADYRLDVIENGDSVMQMPVVVGSSQRKTPIFSETMKYLEFAPYWYVPPTMLREDQLPNIQDDPDYLRENHFQVLTSKGKPVDPLRINWSKVTADNFPGMLRMDPGPWNPLGQVKFIFPNKFYVYLHDTDEPEYFSERIRTFSSGCVRVSQPRRLARYLLGNDWTDEKIERLMSASKPKRIYVEKIPVHIQYWTAWVNKDGQVNFRKDVYLKDHDLEHALSRRLNNGSGEILDNTNDEVSIVY